MGLTGYRSLSCVSETAQSTCYIVRGGRLKQLHLELQRNCLVLACWQIASSQIQFVGMLADCEQSDAVC